MKVEPIHLVVRLATLSDIAKIVRLNRNVYGEHYLSADMVRGQISSFPEGQFVAEYNGEIVGHCATFIINGDVALKPHSWRSITGNGFASRHDPDGDYLYGMEVCVDEQYRGQRIGQRLYDARKQLCQDLELKGIIFGGRLPNLARRIKACKTPEGYVEKALNKEIRDPVLGFQTRNGFEVIGILKAYLPSDKPSLGYATHMLWRNPEVDALSPKARQPRGRTQNAVRIATVQYQVRKVKSFDDFAKQIEYFVDVAADYRADFVLFPELITIPLLSIEPKRLSPYESIQKITAYTDRFVNLMQDLAVSYNINIIGGSHPTRVASGDIENHAYVFLRSGAVYSQPKIHPTPNERHWWNIKGGDGAAVIPTDCGPIGVMICYDSEFPELARILADQGALMMFVPFCTNERRGHLRVRYCCHARAIENQCYMILSGVVGNLPNVDAMDVHYAESCILTPSDYPFARDGVAADTPPNTETIAIADLNLPSLLTSRHTGTTRNYADRRFDLYRITWSKTAFPGVD